MKIRYSLLVLFSLVLVACGGGDVITDSTEDGDTPVTAPSVPDDTTGPDTTGPDTTDFTGTPPEDNPPPIGWIEGAFFVDSADLLVMESYPIQVRLDVAGTVPTPCNEPFWRIADDGAVLSIELFTATDPDLACIQVITDAAVQIPLGSWAGDARSVELNGEVVGEFQS